MWSKSLSASLYSFCSSILFLGNLHHEGLGWFERRDIVRRNVESCVIVDITGCLIGTTFHYERAEATKIDILTMSEALLNYSHELLHHTQHQCFVHARDPRNLCYYTVICEINAMFDLMIYLS